MTTFTRVHFKLGTTYQSSNPKTGSQREAHDDATTKLYLRTLTIYIVYYTMNEKELGSYVDMMKVMA